MRFRVTPKNFALFCIYCVILLYLCAITILNFASFANDQSFYGLIPFKAFSFEYIGYTFALFVAVLLLIFSGVKEYIFDKDKDGFFGLQIKEKDSNGYSRWANEKEIKTDSGIVKINPLDDKLEAAGVPLINKGNAVWVDNGQYHNMVIGATGSGKTECIVKPLVNILSKKGESMVITDPKGEIYEYCAENLKANGYQIIVLNFRDPINGNSWNPLTLPYQYYKEGNKDKGIELLQDVAANVLYTKDNKADPFWEHSAADYFSGLALGLFMDAEEKEINFNSINLMSTVGEERRGANTYVKEYFQEKGEASPAYIFASNTITAPQDTKGGILSTFREKIRLFSTQENLSEMLSFSNFDMRDIGNKKSAVFLIIHDEKKTYHGLMSIFIKQCYETLIDVAHKSGGKLKYRTNFILDEFANMPPLNDVDSMVTAARSRAIRFTFIIQNFSQLDDVYGHEIAETIKGNCGNLIYLISTELKALEEISKMCGEVKSKDKDKTASTPLATVADLQKLKLFQAIIIRWRKNPFKTDLTPDFKIDWGIKREKAVLPVREVQEVKLFDIKKFVSQIKKDEEMDMGGLSFENMGMGNPLMMPNGMSGMGFPSFDNPLKGPSTNEDKDMMDIFSNDNLDSLLEEINKKIEEVEEKEKNDKEKNNDIKETKEKNESELLIKDDFKNDVDNIFTKNNAEIVKEANALPINDSLYLDEEDDDELDLTTQIKLDIDNNMDMTQEINLKDIQNSKINVDKDSVVVDENVVTDDEFYDDFFEE